MLHKLKFEVQFSSTGKTISGEHNFLPGMTAITGPNESGKSLRLEMIRYALWGSAALRSSASSYSKLQVRLDFSVQGKEHSLFRNKNTVTLFRNSEEKPFVTGTKPVNAAISKLFGYGMNVFDVANACLQGQVEALTSMKPTERKNMVDRVIGLDTIDDMVKDIAAEASTQRTEIDVLTKQLIPNLTKPEVPEVGYFATAESLREGLAAIQQQVTKKAALEAELNALKCDPPEDLMETDLPTVEKLMEIGFELKTTLTERTRLQKKLAETEEAVSFKSRWTEQQMLDYLNDVDAQWVAYNQYVADRARYKPHSNLPMTELGLISAAVHAQPMVAMIKSLASHRAECPECRHSFPLDQEKINELEAKLPKGNLDFYFNLFVTEYDSNANKLGMDIVNAPIYYAMEEVKEPSQPYLGPEREIKDELSKLRNTQGLEASAQITRELLERLQIELADPKFLGLEEKLFERKKYDAKVLWIEKQKEKYAAYVALKHRAEPELALLTNLDKRLEAGNALLTAAIQYESDMRAFMLNSQRNDDVKKQIAELTEQLEKNNAIRKSLNDIKPKVKTYLIPSLNRVASNLVSQMTNGNRNKIEVFDDFEILVDNQRVEELSGSGKAVANLAVRIALGTVLTNKVFSVLLADEVDAAMDDERAAFTAQCLRNLKEKTFSQIVLVSHQKPEADHQIEL